VRGGVVVAAQGVLYVVVCAAGPATEVGTLVRLAQDEGWMVCVVATPHARAFIDVRALEELSGFPVRVEYRAPGTTVDVPAPDAILVAPATFNTINKWAAGISDTVALGMVNEAIGLNLPIVALPFVNAALAAHPAYDRSVDQLRAAGVRVLYGPGEPHEPSGAGPRATAFPWRMGLDALSQGA
jgi:phosphopantothenoylcysteine synthetase/decarboxylase